MRAHGNYFDANIHNAGIYLRLSKEDETAGQSESIENQKSFITSYVLDRNWNLIQIYIDDGYSGLNFDRPAFNQMLRDIENKKIDLVITKDLSRLGRDYIDTGYYIERYFPRKGVRYIAINDGIDTSSDNSNNDMSPFKAVINDMYAKDISKKIRTVMDSKRMNGQFVGAFAPYGYQKDPKNKNSFIIDNEVAPIVKRIFQSYLNGVSMCNITRTLNEESIPCPAKYKLTNSTYKNAMIKKYLWTQETVKRILTNPSYMGCMTQKRQEKISYKIDKFKKIPKKDWIIIHGTHEPIINPETFKSVQELIDKKTVHYARKEDSFHLLNGLVFCKECGSKMTYRRNCSGKMVMNCMTYTKYGKSLCSSHIINEKFVEQEVIGDLKEISTYSLSDEFFSIFENIRLEASEKDINNRLKKIETRFDEIRNIIKSLYEDKVKGVLSEQSFLEMSESFGKERETLSFQYSQLEKEKEQQAANKDVDYIELLKRVAAFDILDKSILVKLIDKIEISSEREILISYKFQNPIIE